MLLNKSMTMLLTSSYLLRELDGTEIKIPFARKPIKLFCQHGEELVLEDLEGGIEGTEVEDDED
jgi:hypothetical protein